MFINIIYSTMSRVVEGFPIKVGIECMSNNVVFQRENAGTRINKRNDIVHRDKRRVSTEYDGQKGKIFIQKHREERDAHTNLKGLREEKIYKTNLFLEVLIRYLYSSMRG